jgi:hypothetical protein
MTSTSTATTRPNINGYRQQLEGYLSYQPCLALDVACSEAMSRPQQTIGHTSALFARLIAFSLAE